MNKEKIQIRNNLSLIINTSKFADKDIFSVKFRRYYHRIYAIYIVFMFILSIIAMPYVPFARALSIMLIISVILPIGLISMAYELVRGIKNIKPIDYGKEAERVYYEILDAVREKEKEIAK